MADQQLYPDTEVSVTNLSGSISDLDTQGSGWYTANDTGSDTNLQVGFPQPDSSLSGTQEFFVEIRSTGGSQDPNYDVTVHDGGGGTTSISSGTVADTTGTVVSGTVDASNISDRNSVEVEVQGTASGGRNKATVEVGYIRWDVSLTLSLIVDTVGVTDLNDNSSTLQAELTLAGYNSADVWFNWREVGSSSWNQTPTQTFTQGQEFTESLSGLTYNTQYEFYAEGVTGDGSESDQGSQIQFYTTITLSGTITVEGNNTGGVNITVLDTSGDPAVVGTAQTNSDSTFSIQVSGGGVYHLISRYDDGSGNQYAGPSEHGIQ